MAGKEKREWGTRSCRILWPLYSKRNEEVGSVLEEE